MLCIFYSEVKVLPARIVAYFSLMCAGLKNLKHLY